MSTKNIKQGLSAIANEVLKDVGGEAETIIQQAESQAKDILEKAREDADQTYKTIVEEAAAKTLAETRSIDSQAEVEVRNMLLQTKEELVDEAFTKALGKLQDLTKTEAYHQRLLDLIQEAAEKMTAKNLFVQLNAADQAWLTQDKLNQLSERLQIDLKIMKKPENFLGGCKVQTPAGDVIYDNTFESRMEQFRPELRLKVAKAMFAEEKGNDD